jgi:hypothetical protein
MGDRLFAGRKACCLYSIDIPGGRTPLLDQSNGIRLVVTSMKSSTPARSEAGGGVIKLVGPVRIEKEMEPSIIYVGGPPTENGTFDLEHKILEHDGSVSKWLSLHIRLLDEKDTTPILDMKTFWF